MQTGREKSEWKRKRRTHFVQRVATVGDNMRFLAREPEAETERLKADGALLLVIVVVARDDGEGGEHLGVGVRGGLGLDRRGLGRGGREAGDGRRWRHGGEACSGRRLVVE